MEKLYLIALGGKAENANIEVHDIQFIIGDSIEDSLKPLLERWYGLRNKLHLDSYKELKGADGYQIKICRNKPINRYETNFLYLVNIGGYDPKSMLEVHRIGLFVGKSVSEITQKAEAELYHNDFQQHLDNIINVNEQLFKFYGDDFFLELVKTDINYDLTPDWYGYKRIDI